VHFLSLLDVGVGLVDDGDQEVRQRQGQHDSQSHGHQELDHRELGAVGLGAGHVAEDDLRHDLQRREEVRYDQVCLALLDVFLRSGLKYEDRRQINVKPSTDPVSMTTYAIMS
jgi:hypothetical protein